MSTKDYYETLGVGKSASSSELKKAYLKQAKQYHPDVNSSPDAEKKFKEISQAYDILKDPQKKSAYDQMGHAAFEQGGTGGQHGGGGFGGFGGQGADMNDIFGDFFSDFMGGGRSRGRSKRSSAVRGSDLKYNMEITLEEAFTGTDKKINFTAETTCSPCNGMGSKSPNSKTTCGTCGGHGALRMQQGFFTVEQTCNKCGGQGTIIKDPCGSCYGKGRQTKKKELLVNVPAGVENGVRIRIAGEGEAGVRGVQVGDLYIFISLKPHSVFKVDGADLHLKLPLTFTKAALGGEVEIPTIEGKKVYLTIPPGTETTDRLRLRGQGMSKVRSSARGDLYAHAHVVIPKKLSKKQRDLLEELDKDLSQPNNFNDEGFFSKLKNIWS